MSGNGGNSSNFAEATGMKMMLDVVDKMSK